jgi:PAS domain S-box-containing protein
MILEIENFEIDTALSVDEAFKKMEKQNFDAIVSDYEMPLKSGLDFLRELREQSIDTPFILFTGKGREEVVVKALNLGADRYINKNGSAETVYCELAHAINKTVEQKKSRQMHAKSESKYRMLVEKSLQGIIIVKLNPVKLAFANDAMGKTLGYSTQELMSLSAEGIMSLVHGEDRADFFTHIRKRLQGEQENSSYEFRALRKDGSTIWLNCLADGVEYDGQPAAQGMFIDITERKKTEETLRENEQRYRELTNSLPNTVFETDMNGQIVFANKIAYEISGYSRQEVEKGFNIMQVLSPEDRERAKENIRQLLAGGDSSPIEYTFVRKNGTRFPALITTALIVCQNKVTGLRGLVLDITELKKAEEIMRKSEERYRELANSLPEIVFETDLTGKITFFSNKALEITGFTREELENGLNMLSFVVPNEREMAIANMMKSMTGEKIGSNEYTLSRKNGTTFPALVSTSPIISQNKVIGLRGLVIDITERKKTEEAIRLSEEKYRNLFENASDIILTGDLSGKITSVNEAVKKYGFQKEQIVGRNVREFLSSEDSARQGKVFQEVSLGKSLSGELAPVVIGKRTFEVKTDPLKIVDKVVGFQTILRDFTERKKAEEDLNRTMNELLLVNEKLNVMGRLTRHDIRNKLTGLSGNLFILKKTHGNCTDIMSQLDGMERSCNSIVKILEFSRMYEELGVKELCFLDVEKTVDEAVVLFSAPQNVKIINECHGLKVLADSFLKQLFYNLIENSVKHGKKVTEIRVHYVKADQDKLGLIYEDDGIGVPIEMKQKIFEEGFSTSGSTGYGLNLIKKTMEVYGWVIQENGESGKGARFAITIPRFNKDGKENIQVHEHTHRDSLT